MFTCILCVFFILDYLISKWSMSSVVYHIAIGAGGLGFDYRAGQIGHSVAKGSTPLRRCFGAVLPAAQALSCGASNPDTCSLHASA